MTLNIRKNTSEKPGPVRFDALTGIRWLAACLVFVYHNRKYFRYDIHPELLRLVNEFNIGVSLFFVLSGFLIAYSYSDAPLQSHRHYLRYILVRVARIFPLYWFIISLYYLDPAFGKGNIHFLTYSLFHGLSGKLCLQGIAQAWSLTVEMSFYVLAPLLCFLHRKHALYLIGALFLLLGITWTAGVAWQWADGNPRHFFQPLQFILSGTFPGRSTEFMAGILLASAIRSNRVWLQRLRHKTWLGFAGFFATAYCIGLFQTDIYHHGTEHPAGLALHAFVLPVFVGLILAGLIYEKTWLQRFFASRPLVLLGNASFAFYLIHISYVNLKIKTYLLMPDRNFVFLWLVAIGLYLLIEKPVYDKCRVWIKRI